MSIAISQTIHVLQIIVQTVPVGTNLALLQLMWTIINGSFLQSRGAIFPALAANGYTPEESYRIWGAFRHGVWRSNELVSRWRSHVLNEGQWQSRYYEGYRPVAVDWTAIWRFKLQGWTGKLFNGLIGRAVCGIGFGLVCDVGEVEGQRIPLLRRIIRTSAKDRSETKLKMDTLRWVRRHLDENEVAIIDAGVKLGEMQQIRMPRFVIRLARNCTARRNVLPAYKGRGCRPQWGDKVRPLSRTRLKNETEATQADKCQTFRFKGREIQAHGWSDLVLPTCKPGEAIETFAIWVFFDPLYKTPLVLGTNLEHAQPLTVFSLYLDRWPVEQIPLVAKQMLGLHRQFVFAPEACNRLPELAFLLGNILTYLAAILPPLPTGFWDKHPKKRLVVCGDSWQPRNFLKMPFLTPNFAKRTPLRHICLKVRRLIAAKKLKLNSSHQFITVFQPIF